VTSTEQLLHRSGRCSSPVRSIQARKPQNTKQAYRAPNRPKLETAATRDNRELTHMFNLAKTQLRSASDRSVRGTGQTGVAWTLGMNNTRGSTPPHPTPDLSNRSTDLRKTLGIVGTPNGESIAKLLSTKTRQSRGIEEIPPRTPLTIEHCNPKIEPLYSRIWEGIKGKRTMKGSHIHPPPNSQKKGP
jgi:hypothetical protein